MLRIKKISEVLGRNAYTDSGDFLGQIEEANLSENKVGGWKIKVSGEVSQLIGARGIIVPHQFVKSIGDIFIIDKASLPIKQEEEDELEKEKQEESQAENNLM